MPKITVHNAYHYALCLLAFSLSFPSTLFPIGIASLGIIAFYLRIKDKNTQIDKRMTLFYVVIFAYIALRIIGNEDIRYGFRVLERNLPLLLVPLLIIPNKIKQPKDFYRSFALGISLASVIAMLGVGYDQFIVVKDEPTWYFSVIDDYGFHSTYMAMYALVALVMLSERKLFTQTITVAISALLGFFVLFSSSRIALIVLLLLLLIKAISSGKKIYYYGLALVGVLLIAVFSFSEDFRFKINQLKDFQGFTYYDNNNYGSVSVRVAKIKASTMLWKENKWFGKGTGDTREALVQKYRSKEIKCWPCARERYNSHNQYLNILAAYGVVGLLLFGAWIAYLLFTARKGNNKLLLGVLFVFLLISLTESILEVSRGVMPVFLLLYYLPLAKCIEDGE